MHATRTLPPLPRPARLVCQSRSILQLTTEAVVTRVRAALVVVRAASAETSASVPEVGDIPLQENRENEWTDGGALRYGTRDDVSVFRGQSYPSIRSLALEHHPTTTAGDSDSSKRP